MIYLDHNATTSVHPQVVSALLPYLTEKIGNPASIHGAGRDVRRGLDEARRQVAALFGVHDSQIIFTSGGTEANHLALLGIAAKTDFRGHVLTSAVEHPSVLNVCEVLEKRGMAISRLPVDGAGRLGTDAVRSALREDTVVVSIMHANNETGVLQPIAKIGAICRQAGVPFHSDTVQSVGKLPVEFDRLSTDMLSVSAHKFGGPKGVGALILDKRLSLEPLQVGGGQERGRRSGTENLSGIVGFGTAAALASQSMAETTTHLTSLQSELEERLQTQLPGCVIFGHEAQRLPNTCALGFPGMDGETLVMSLDLAGIAVSSGSACSSGRTTPSHVLKAMGVKPELAQSLVRVSMGWHTTHEEITRFVSVYVRIIKQLQSMAGPLAMAV